MLSGFDLLLLAVLLYQTWRGLQQGLIRAFVGVVGWLVALYAGSHYAKSIAPLFSGVVADPTLQIAVAFMALVVMMWGMLWAAGFIIRQFIRALALGPVERLAGGVFGAMKGLLMVLIVLNMLAPFASRADFWQRSHITPILLPYAPLALHVSRQWAERTWHGLQSPPRAVPVS
ncbi:MAG: hypothetical protein RLY58_1914 [Pseudomonadota bacterium]|jgi:membrane protein required for colicin V production